MRFLGTLVAFFVFGLGALHAGDDGFKSLFNGKDLDGWYNVNCAPSTFYAKDGMIITTGKPTGYLRTDRQYENFILEFEWFHAPNPKGSVGNSGLFVWGDPVPAMGTGYTRSIEVQVLVNLEKKNAYTSQGDLFSIWGAHCKPDRPHPMGWERCLPSENRCKGEYEWNHYRVEANDGVLKLAVNGKVVSGVSACNPRKGYLALESEGSECRFKNLKIKELPSTNPGPSEVCDVDKGLQCLFTGLDLSGWKTTDALKANWKMNDGVLNYNAKGEADSTLWSEKSFGDFEMVCDWKSNAPAAICARGNVKNQVPLEPENKGWNRAIIRLKGDRLTLTINKQGAQYFNMTGTEARGPIGLQATGAPIQFRNVFVREVNGQK